MNISGIGKNTSAVRARNMREAFRSAIKTVELGEYEKYRNMKCCLTYKNGVLETG